MTMTTTINAQSTQLADTEFTLPSPKLLKAFLRDHSFNQWIGYAWDAWFDAALTARSNNQDFWIGDFLLSPYCRDRIDMLADVPVISDAPARLRQVAAIITNDPSRLDMRSFHCGTIHCIAGWATHLAATSLDPTGDVGDFVESTGLSEPVLPTMLLGHEAACCFYDTRDDSAARAFLKQRLHPA